MVHIRSAYLQYVDKSWLRPRSAEKFPKQQKKNVKVYYTGTCPYVPSFLNTAQPCHETHVAAPGSINSERLTAKPAREGFVRMCACTASVRIGIGAVCVECGRPKRPITMLNYTHTKALPEKKKKKKRTPYTPRMTRHEKPFFFLGKPRKKGFALRASRASL